MKEKTIYELGFFDGVHVGHQALLHHCRRLATEYGASAGVVTFVGHPDALVLGKTPELINTQADRKALLLGYGMDRVLEIPFDRELMAMPWQDFLHSLPQGAGFVCGDDFRFGYKGEGSAKTLAQWCDERGLPWAVVPEQTVNGTRVSSTHIRSLIKAGDMETAARFLGHNHVLSGQVVAGRGLGHTIGVPTANLVLPQGLACPQFGVYACKVRMEGKVYRAVTNVGTRPTVGGHHVRVESWILNFEGDLYGKQITLEFERFLRPEKKFGSLEELRAQIQKDAQVL